MASRKIIPFIGVYDVLSATLAARHYDGLFISGFSFAASYYGLPDIGFISWSDIVAFVQRVRTVLPRHHLIVDIDDGYCDVEVGCHVTHLLETIGASGVIIEDQKRPRKCGHFDGKQIMELEDFVVKLKRVLTTRQDMIVVARTDANEIEEISRRVFAFQEAGADVILVDGIKNFEMLKEVKKHVTKPLMFNQIAGGKTGPCTLKELSDAGVSLVNYSTPCLFAAQVAVDKAIRLLKENDGLLSSEVGIKQCTAILNENLEGRDKR